MANYICLKGVCYLFLCDDKILNYITRTYVLKSNLIAALSHFNHFLKDITLELIILFIILVFSVWVMMWTGE